jgi:alcohol dehydrogenase
MYGFAPFGGEWGGFLADRIRVPFADAMLVPLPNGLDPVAVASCSDNVADAWRSVGPGLIESPGAEVLIVAGGGSVPLYAVDLAVALGAACVHYLDTDATRLSLAAHLGANTIEGPPPRQLGPFPITVNASRTPEGLGCALRSTTPDGRCTSIGIYMEDTPLPLYEMYINGVTFLTGRTHARPAIPQLLEMTGSGQIHPEVVTTEIAEWDAITEVLQDPPMKLVMRRTVEQ